MGGAAEESEPARSMEQDLKKGGCPGSVCSPLFFVQTGRQPTGMCHPYQDRSSLNCVRHIHSPDVLHCSLS